VNIGYSLDEIFEIAAQIERNGAAFYRTAADSVEAGATRDLLLGLAKDEDDHEQTFEEMRRELVNKPGVADCDRDGVVAGYLQAVAGQYVFNRADPQGALSAGVSASEILQMAIDKERDSIVLYVGLVDAVPGPEDQGKVGLIIREERKHVVKLFTELKKLS